MQSFRGRDLCKFEYEFRFILFVLSQSAVQARSSSSLFDRPHNHRNHHQGSPKYRSISEEISSDVFTLL